MKHAKGFTLVELMIAAVIISIISAIALPAYSNYVMRGKISEATSNLASARVSMEQWYQDNRTYQSVPANGTACGATMPVAPQVQYFTFACAAATANSYTVTATGVGNMAGFTYTVDNTNAKLTTAVPAGWGTAPVSCWVTKQGGAC